MVPLGIDPAGHGVVGFGEPEDVVDALPEFAGEALVVALALCVEFELGVPVFDGCVPDGTHGAVPGVLVAGTVMD